MLYPIPYLPAPPAPPRPVRTLEEEDHQMAATDRFVPSAVYDDNMPYHVMEGEEEVACCLASILPCR